MTRLCGCLSSFVIYNSGGGDCGRRLVHVDEFAQGILDHSRMQGGGGRGAMVCGGWCKGAGG